METKVPEHKGSKLNDDELLTTNDVAEILKVPVGTVRQWRSNRVGPHGFRVGKHVRYRRSTVEAYITTLENEE